MSNGWGEYRTTIDKCMAAYDRCPPWLRWAMRYAVADWSSEQLLDASRALTRTEIMAALRAGDRRETILAYGPNHPEAQ